MAEISKGQVNLNTVLASLGTAGFAGFNLGNLFGGNHCNDPNGIPVSRYEADLMNKINELTTEVKFRDSSIYTDQKILEAYKDLSAKISAHDAAIAQQAVYNATNTATIGCLSQQIAQLMGLTKIVIPADGICPTPMPLYNSWVAPVAPAAGTGA
jgi:hypothetical protein